MSQARPNGTVSDLDMLPAFPRSHFLAHVLLAAARISLAILIVPLVSHHVPLHSPTFQSPCYHHFLYHSSGTDNAHK